MKATEAAALLTVCAAYDNRKPDADQAKAWAMALDGLRFEDARDAIVAHYRKTRDWLMPSDVISGVKAIRGGRVLEFGPIPDPPPSIDPDDTAGYGRWLAETIEAIADGTYQAPEPVALGRRDVASLGQIGQKVPRA